MRQRQSDELLSAAHFGFKHFCPKHQMFCLCPVPIGVHPVKIFFVTMMHADGHRCNDDSENCGWLCDTASKPPTLLACRQEIVAYCPKGWILTGWYALSSRRSKNTLSGLSAFICVHPVKMLFFASITQPKWQQQNNSSLCLLTFNLAPFVFCFLPLTSYL